MATAKVSLLFLALVAASWTQPLDDRGLILDAILKKLLEGLRPKIKDLAIPEQKLSLNESVGNVTFLLTNGTVKDLDTFAIQKLTTTVIPLKLTNLTITLEDVLLTGDYQLSGTVIFPPMVELLKVFGEGKARIQLKGIFFTIAADFTYNDGVLQIPEGGLHGFDFYLRQCHTELENLMGGGETAKFINRFVSYFIPDVIRDYRQTIFETMREPLIHIINGYLAGNTTRLIADDPLTNFL